MAIAARVGCKIPKNTNLTHPEIPHLILGPFSTVTGNTTLYTCMLGTVDAAKEVVVAASKAKPAGVVITDPTYNWGATVCGNYVLLPALIDVYLCAYGPCLVAMDVSEVTDAVMPIGTYVWAATNGSGFCAPQPDTTTGTAGEFCIGATLDNNAGFTTLAAGADGDLVEVFVDINEMTVSGA